MTMHNVANLGSLLHYNAREQSTVYMCRTLRAGTVFLLNGDPYALRRHAKRTPKLPLERTRPTYAGLWQIVANCSLFCKLLDNKKV